MKEEIRIEPLHGDILLEIDPETPFSADFLTVSPLFRLLNFAKRAFPDRSLAPGFSCCCRTSGEARQSPPSRRRGGRDLKKMLRSILCGADGVVVSNYRFIHPERFLTIGGLKQPPRLRLLRNGAIFSYGAATPPSRRRGILLNDAFGISQAQAGGWQNAATRAVSL
jgi:hypothetical protein